MTCPLKLDPSEDLLQILRGWGFVGGRISGLAESGNHRAPGSGSGALRRKVSGHNKRLLRLVRSRPEYVEAFDFDGEIETIEPLLFCSGAF